MAKSTQSSQHELPVRLSDVSTRESSTGNGLHKGLNALLEEVSHLRAELARLTLERDAAVTRARSHLVDIDEHVSSSRKLEKELLVAVEQADKRTRQLDDLKQQVEVLRAKHGQDVSDGKRKLSELKQQLDLLKKSEIAATRESRKLSKELGRVMSSGKYRVGSMLVDAVRRPGVNTLMLPWRLLKLPFSSKRRSGGTGKTSG